MPVAIATGLTRPFVGDVVAGLIEPAHGAAAFSEHRGRRSFSQTLLASQRGSLRRRTHWASGPHESTSKTLRHWSAGWKTFRTEDSNAMPVQVGVGA